MYPQVKKLPQETFALERGGEPENHGLLFFGKSAKEFIPNDEEAPVIFVDVFFVAGVVHPVVRRSDDDFFQKAELPDRAGVCEERISPVDSQNAQNHFCRKTHDRQYAPKQHANERLKNSDACAHGKVELRTGVVHHMLRPEYIHGVAESVVPIPQKIYQHKQQNPLPIVLINGKEGKMFVQKLIHKVKTPRENQSAQPIENADRQVGNGVGKFIVFLPFLG